MERKTRKPRNWFKYRRFMVIASVALLFLFKFQNCATSPKTLMPTVPAGERAPSSSQKFPAGQKADAGLSNGVSFPQRKLALKRETEAVEIEGVCDLAKHGSILGWRVYDSSGEEVSRGYSACEAGRFLVELAPVQEFVCNQPYKVTARLEQGEESALDVYRSCDPI